MMQTARDREETETKPQKLRLGHVVCIRGLCLRQAGGLSISVSLPLTWTHSHGTRIFRCLQCSEPVEIDTWDLLNEQFFPLRPDVELRVFGFYSLVCDLSFTASMTNVRRFFGGPSLQG